MAMCCEEALEGVNEEGTGGEDYKEVEQSAEVEMREKEEEEEEI